MQIESYEVEPIDQTEMQALAAEGEMIELIESLNLKGQKALMNPETKSLVPYRHITKEERFTFSLLFPDKCAIEEYNAGPIPLRVLQIAAHARALEMKELSYLQVWYPKQGIDDPVLVARPGYYQDPCFLLARWGKALLPFEQLFEEAKKKAYEVGLAKLRGIEAQIKSYLLDPDSVFGAKIAEGEIPSPTLYL